MNTIEIELPVYDDEGIVVDTTIAIMNNDQIQDIIAQSIEVIYAMRKYQANDCQGDQQDINDAMAELEEALQAYSVIEDDDYFPGCLQEN